MNAKFHEELIIGMLVVDTGIPFIFAFAKASPFEFGGGRLLVRII
jgi:hypothetical protein